ncbi:hypothetical protein VE00_02602 [Pseudogymnoascus sp. WSF 3629]|nr:hypothetical protein VE00_02602 [Pseudogymnoascus sp. WSF 3629]
MNKEKRLDEIKQFRERLAECQKAALEIRQGEVMGGTGGSDGLVRAIKRVWPGAVVVRNYKFYERVSNIRLYTVDVEETINKSPPGKFNAGGVVTFAANYGKTADYLPVEQEHYRVTEQHINLQTKERERLNGGC